MTATPYETMPESTPRLSEAMFGLAWSDLVPCALGGGGARLRLAEYAEVERFFAEHRDVLLAPEVAGSGFAGLDDGPAKSRFCGHALDSFAIEADGRTVGVFVGQATDWSTYYLRYLGMEPDYRGAGAVVGIIDLFGAFLAPFGFQRMEMDVSISHLPQLRRVLGRSFYPMGTLHSERWGALVHLVQFLSNEHEAAFLNQFSAGLRPRADGTPSARQSSETTTQARR